MGEGRLRRLGRLCRGTRLTGPGSSPARPTESLATPTSLPPSTKPLGSPGWHPPPFTHLECTAVQQGAAQQLVARGAAGRRVGLRTARRAAGRGHTAGPHIADEHIAGGAGPLAKPARRGVPAAEGWWWRQGQGGGVCRDAVPWLRPPPSVPTTTAGGGAGVRAQAGLTRGWTTQTSCCQSWRAG